jgi:hypothetical protein
MPRGGKREGAGRKPNVIISLPHVRGKIAEQIMGDKRFSPIERIFNLLETGNKNLQWDILRTVIYQLDGLPPQAIHLNANVSVDLATRRQRVEEMLLALVE